MVDVGAKSVTRRLATARALVSLPSHVFAALAGEQGEAEAEAGAGAASVRVRELRAAKGPVFATAIVAGVTGVKHTPMLIPFCHPLPVDKADFDVRVLTPAEAAAEAVGAAGRRVIEIRCTVGATHKTGVEMEALTGASVAALCVYDMCKALSHDIEVCSVRLERKEGGKAPFVRVQEGAAAREQ